MNYHVMTLFPDMITNAMSESITGRALKAGYLALEAVNIRDFADNKHNRVDDYPYGGGAGMVMQAGYYDKDPGAGRISSCEGDLSDTAGKGL